MANAVIEAGFLIDKMNDVGNTNVRQFRIERMGNRFRIVAVWQVPVDVFTAAVTERKSQWPGNFLSTLQTSR